MRQIQTISTLVIAGLAASQVAAAGLDFIMVGDFAWIADMTNTSLTFDAINAYVGNVTANGGKIDFFMTMGDNLYPLDEVHPTDEEVDIMMGCFQRPHIKDLLIYAIRGNHDCLTADPYFYINVTKRYPTWRMPDYYFSRLFDIGNGKKFGTLFVDTCLGLCSNFSYANGTGGQLLMDGHPIMEDSEDMLSEKAQKLRWACTSDPVTTKMGYDMHVWVNQTLYEWSKDPSIVWTATVQHHPLFSKWWSDYLNITTNMLPILIDRKVDFYLNGHEHTLTYAYYPYSQVSSFLKDLHSEDTYLEAGYTCSLDQELFFGYNFRYSEFTKGNALHQITTGATGNDFTNICTSRPTMGRYRWASNMKHGFSVVHVDERAFTVVYMGVDWKTQESKEIYRVTVYNEDASESVVAQ